MPLSNRNPWQALVERARPRARHVGTGDRELVARIQEQAACTGRLTDAELLAGAQDLRAQTGVSSSESSESIMIRTGALLQEAVRRTLGVVLYDEQLLAGLVLARGAVAEMQTGEGKTLAAMLPACRHVLAGRKVHVATLNAYLAERDFQWLQPVFAALGISSSLLPEAAPAAEKRQAYAADVTYGTGYEFGFDYLREQLAILGDGRQPLGKRQRDQWRGIATLQHTLADREQVFALVDEIDSVLIDEACLPLLISSGTSAQHDEPTAYLAARQIAAALVADRDYVVQPQARSVTLTASGRQKIHDRLAELKVGRLRRAWSVYVEQALHAQWLLERDVDYVILDGQIALVDEYTGRIFVDRTWRDGLHQAIEVKEGLAPTAEQTSAAQLTRQRYFGLYQTISGMTGTACAAAPEFWQVYRLPVVAIPLRRPCRRELLPTRYFSDVESKWQAVVAAVAQVHASSRPVLIASRTIENSELVAQRLSAAKISFRLLNGRQDASEAAIIAASGQAGAVTIATNMAGRGTDIKLASGVDELGGLHVLSVERHESARIDCQLIGRAGRQGNRGSCQFFVAADDPLVQRLAPGLRSRLNSMPPQGAFSPELDAAIEALQTRLEAERCDQRRRLLAYDRWLDTVREKLGR